MYGAVIASEASWQQAHPTYPTWLRLQGLIKGRAAWEKWWAGLAGRRPRDAAAALRELAEAGEDFWAAAQAVTTGHKRESGRTTPLRLARDLVHQEPASG
jgi:hypothetical protein